MVLKSLLRWLRTNFTSLVLALLLGLTVWIVANQEQNPVEEKDFSAVPIAVSGLKPELLIMNDYLRTATLRLRAQHNTLLSLSLSDIVVTADLADLGPGIHHVPLNIDIAAQAQLISSNPSSIQIDIEEERQREISVHVNLAGQLATGYISDTPVITPSRVSIRGPRSAVELVSDIQTDVSLDDLRETFSDELPLIAVDANGNIISNVSIEPGNAQVTIAVTQKADYRDIAIRALTIGQPEKGYYVTGITVTPSIITVRGEPETIKTMEPFVETLPVSLNGLTDDLFSDVTLDLPEGVTPIEAGPIRIAITIEAQYSSQSLDIPVQAVGLGNKLKAAFSPETVTVILSGPLPALNQLNPAEDIIVIIDLTGLKPGTYQLEPKVELKRSDIVLESSFPVVISVTIERE